MNKFENLSKYEGTKKKLRLEQAFSASILAVMIGFGSNSNANADTVIKAQSVGEGTQSKPSKNVSSSEGKISPNIYESKNPKREVERNQEKLSSGKEKSGSNLTEENKEKEASEEQSRKTFGEIIDNLGNKITSEEAYILLGKYYLKKKEDGVLYYTRGQLSKLRNLLGVQSNGNLFNSKDISSLKEIGSQVKYFDSSYSSSHKFQLKDISLNDKLEGYYKNFNDIYLHNGVIGKNGNITSGSIKVDNCNIGSWCDKKLFNIENPTTYSNIKYRASRYRYDRDEGELIN